jgi:flagella basal body P-ring formation protein FlgA
VKRDDVVRALRAAGLGGSPTGAPNCRARPRVEIVQGRELEDVARNALISAFPGRDIEVEIARPAADVPLVAPAIRRELAADLGRRDLRPGSWSVPVDVRIDGSRAQTAWIALDVRVFERRPTATRDLRRGESIDGAAWTLERGLVDASAPASPAPELLIGATCTRDLPRGARITDLDVRRDPLVRSGDVVEIEVVRGAVRARSRAVARAQGALGDRVEVQTGEGQRRLVGVVVARGLVRVELAVSPR